MDKQQSKRKLHLVQSEITWLHSQLSEKYSEMAICLALQPYTEEQNQRMRGVLETAQRLLIHPVQEIIVYRQQSGAEGFTEQYERDRQEVLKMIARALEED